MPVFFGVDTLIKQAHEITLDHDIIASAYFLLSRWEEYVIPVRDNHQRFLETESFTVKHSLIKRPLVNEYVAYLSAIANELGYTFRNSSSYYFRVTHDLDMILKWPNSKFFYKTIIGDLLKRRSVKLAIENIRRRKVGNDPYDVYDFFINCAEQYNVETIYYFLVNEYNIPILHSNYGKILLQRLEKLSYTLALHPDLGTFKNLDQMRDEKLVLEKLVGKEIVHSRQHFLQLQLPSLWNHLNNLGIGTDSSLYYKTYPGFRTGTCSPHTVFDFIKKKHLQIKEFPLMFMDQTFKQGQNAQTVYEDCKELIAITKKHKGVFTLLWHNSNLNDYGWEKYKKYYEKILMLS